MNEQDLSELKAAAEEAQLFTENDFDLRGTPEESERIQANIKFFSMAKKYVPELVDRVLSTKQIENRLERNFFGKIGCFVMAFSISIPILSVAALIFAIAQFVN